MDLFESPHPPGQRIVPAGTSAASTYCTDYLWELV
jgi:hypothetical protein